jgi:hypothetical protein
MPTREPENRARVRNRVLKRHDFENWYASLCTSGCLIVVLTILFSIGLLNRETSNRIIRSIAMSFSGGSDGFTADDEADVATNGGDGTAPVDGGEASADRGSGAVGDGRADKYYGSNRPGTKKKFRRWMKFQIISQAERTGRIVAGRKESISFDLRIQPVHGMLPNREQLAHISSGLRSDLHNTTFVYFYLPGMDHRLGAWATAHHEPGDSFDVRFFESNMPVEFQ